MSRNLHNCKSLRGFTLIELLVVISIIAVLAGILLPAIMAVSTATKRASTESLIGRLGVAIARFEKDTTMLPPDYMPASFIGSVSTTLLYPGFKQPNDSEILPPEILAGALGNPNLAENADVRNYIPNITGHVPYTNFTKGRELQDYNANGFPELVDAWGRPLLYNRSPFHPNHQLRDCDFSEPSTNGRRPWHRPESYDLYSVGADGQTGDNDLPTTFSTTALLRTYCEKAMDKANDGNAEDDIANWK